MRFAFYKKGEPRKNVYNTDLQVTLDNFDYDTYDFYAFNDDSLPENMQAFFKLAEDYLQTNKLPFIILSERTLISRVEELEFNNEMQNITGDYETIYVNVPTDVEHIYSFYEEEFLSDEEKLKTQLEKELSRSSYPSFKQQPNRVPLQVVMQNKDSEVSVRLMHSTLKKKKGNKYFLFTVNLYKNVKTLFTENESRLYEVTTSLEDNLLDTEHPGFTEDVNNVALIVHGFMSRTEGNFVQLKKSLVESGKYDKIFGYSYSPNKVSIKSNGDILYEKLDNSGLLNSNINLDIYAHSEGGLVTRSMIAYKLNSESEHSIRNFITAGTPHEGTDFAKRGNQLLKLPRIALLVAGLIKSPDNESVEILKEVLYYYYRFKENKGLIDMIPKSRFLLELQSKNLNINGAIIFASYHYNNNTWSGKLLVHMLNSVVFHSKDPHDKIVPTASSRYTSYPGKAIIIDDEGGHSDYFSKVDKATFIVNKVTAL